LNPVSDPVQRPVDRQQIVLLEREVDATVFDVAGNYQRL
jgi:hypothetical protein